jgi:hypothetical protein
MSVQSSVGATQPSSFELAAASARRTPLALARALSGPLALAGLLACTGLIAIASPHTSDLLPASIQPPPPALAGPFAGAGLTLGAAPLILILAAMFACYAIVVLRGPGLPGQIVFGTIAAVLVLVVLAAPLFSTDVFSYQAYARMWARYGIDPYLHGPRTIMLDPIYPYVGAAWVTAPSAYGPLFTLISGAFAPLGVAAAVLAYKALAALSCLISVALVRQAARLRGSDPACAAALVGLNPLVTLYGVGGSHNDVVMLVGLCAALYLLLARRPLAGGAAISLGAAVKLTGGLLLPFALAARSGTLTARRRWLPAVGAAAAAIAIAAASLAVFGKGTFALPEALVESQNAGDWHSVPGFIALSFGLGGVSHLAAGMLGLLALAAIAWLVRLVALGALDWIEGAAWATVAILVSANALLPWYVSWLLPLVALSADRRLWRTAVWLTGIVLGLQLLGYLPHPTALLAA